MSTVFVAVIIIAITVIPPFIFIHLNKRREKQRQEAFLEHLKEAGAKRGLSFTHHEALKDKMLGLDANNQNLLLLTFDTAHTETIIDLADVETCTLHKEYDQFNISDNKNTKTEHVLTRINLKMAFSTNTSSSLIGFYDNHVNSIYEMPELEKKAKNGKA